jgi:hypothetical protein
MYVWRSGGVETKIFGDSHGDIMITQGRERISAHYSFWPRLAATALKFADTVGIEIPEAKDWRSLMNRHSWDGRIALHEDGYKYFLLEFPGQILAQLPDKVDTTVVKKPFFGWMVPDSPPNITHVPVIDLEDRLVFHTNKDRGKGSGIVLSLRGDKQMFFPYIYVAKEDAGHLFKGAVHCMMTWQARTQPAYLALMLWQYEQLKAGKTAEQIEKESSQFES